MGCWKGSEMRKGVKLNMVKIKFCGIRRAEDVEAVNRLKPDFAGFVLAKSKRQVTLEQASYFKLILDKDIKTVAVLVNMHVEEAASLANSGIVDMLQLHGDEDAGYIAKLKKLTKAKIIKAIRLQPGEAEQNAELMAPAGLADYYLFDTFVPDTYGGTGKPFSLSLLNGLNIDKPFFLAGGLDSENISDIVQEVQADAALKPFFYGIDVSSGIETNGFKDSLKMEKFMNVVRYG